MNLSPPSKFFCYDKARKRVHLLGKRIHHGGIGCVGLVICAALIAHDWKDRWWLKDL